ncbi:transglycosylase domain-containing protein [Halocynthiibacter styelae]|uniref:Transglycosylase domain-containing protein n=1 Tax=Halocynthiibacter styelae TaxID=2761955 RepID=A0A8J7J046_9RHOB|nr:transglycosylase domain-containing protein [Paenihalocynthiibacter styelae]MBI1495229.1 transglycosylase domain-containing protein [Paenihalocynthiibacter styelae]
MKQIVFILALLFSAGALSAQQHSFEFEAGTITLADLRQAFDEMSPYWPEVPDLIARAMVAAEDPNFHDRVSMSSPITSNLADALMFDQAPGLKTHAARFKMTLLLANALTHDEILNWYLQAIYTGQGCYGTAATAWAYFDVGHDALTAEKVAYVIALSRSPQGYHPQREQERALLSRNRVLEEMQKAGTFPKSQLAVLQALPLGVIDPLERCDLG